ncbi:MAG TPA: DUF2007 domain-containing protein [bacterium]|nr:DUF2007 domain-containing protein [bacterium]
MPDEMQTVMTYNDPIQAQLAKAQLEAQGIECYLADVETGSNTVLLYGLGVRVQVLDADAARAGEILEKWERETVKAERRKNCPHCPDCFSQETRRVPFNRFLLAFALLTLFLFYFIPSIYVFLIFVVAAVYTMRREEWRCDQCGRRFHPTK